MVRQGNLIFTIHLDYLLGGAAIDIFTPLTVDRYCHGDANCITLRLLAKAPANKGIQTSDMFRSDIDAARENGPVSRTATASGVAKNRVFVNSCGWISAQTVTASQHAGVGTRPNATVLGAVRFERAD